MTRGDADHLSIVIHELRNPLIGIDAAARVLAGELGSHPAAKRATAIAAEAKALLGLLDGVAEADAADAGRLRSLPAPLDLARTVRETVAAAHLPGRSMAVRGADAPVMVHADDGRIRQVLRNLLLNAAQYSPARSPIEVELALDTRSRTATVHVRDQGPGIPAAERRKLFRKFTRLSTAGATRGSGLGLYISKAIVEEHGGEIDVQSVPGGGSDFSFTLPVRAGRRSSGARTRPAHPSAST
ncbi:MAG: HAMP domain-containing histidine kinase [Chloroflexota bacterium]|nr:HAMP domain-containing histidine kinase [Chloroflexota bacterium]